nr:hypothetical protein CFP56_00851 [Quercus suber]
MAASQGLCSIPCTHALPCHVLGRYASRTYIIVLFFSHRTRPSSFAIRFIIAILDYKTFYAEVALYKWFWRYQLTRHISSDGGRPYRPPSPTNLPPPGFHTASRLTFRFRDIIQNVATIAIAAAPPTTPPAIAGVEKAWSDWVRSDSGTTVAIVGIEDEVLVIDMVSVESKADDEDLEVKTADCSPSYVDVTTIVDPSRDAESAAVCVMTNVVRTMEFSVTCGAMEDASSVVVIVDVDVLVAVVVVTVPQ